MREFEDMSLGERIKSRRKSLNMSQEKLATLAGITQTQISRYELGTAEPVASNLMALAKVLNVSLEWLVGITDEPPDAPREEKDLSDSEQRILALYRAKSEKQQRVIAELLEAFQ